MNALLLALAINLVNGNVAPLASLRQAPANGWIGYTIATRDEMRISSCGRCSLEDDDGVSFNRQSGATKQVILLVRFRDGAPERIRFFSPDCSIDAGGQTVHWIENVPHDQSIAFLREIVDRGAKRARSGALLALSMHENATETLIDIARHHADREVRGKALFWLSQQAGRKAAAALKDAVDNDPEESVRGKAVFGIAQLPNDQSIPMLVDLMKNNRSKEVRRKAAFWLGQKNDPRALAAIEDILSR